MKPQKPATKARKWVVVGSVLATASVLCATPGPVQAGGIPGSRGLVQSGPRPGTD